MKMSVTKVKLRLPPLPTIRELLKLYGLRALRQLSQNFLLDRRITTKIVKVMGKVMDGQVLEVGPGPGSITRPIIERGPKRLILIEKDRRFRPTLEMLAEGAHCDVDLIFDDILRVNMERMFPEEEKRDWTDMPPNIHIIGNLPFSVATPLIVRWIRDISLRQSAWRYGRVDLTLTFQKEVAERLAAPILSKQRSRLSMMAQNWCYVQHVFNIPGSAFIPKPEVDVGVVKMVPLVQPVVDFPFPFVEKVVRVLFSSRQKHIIKPLSGLFPKPLQERLVTRLLKDADMPHTTRAVQVTLPELGRILAAYSAILQEYPAIEKYNFRQPQDYDIESEEWLQENGVEEEVIEDFIIDKPH